jgi:hypothetical protein
MGSIQTLAAIAIATTPNDGFLFPQLQELRLSGTSPLYDATPLSVLFNPGISVLHVTLTMATNYKNLTFLASVFHRCPNLADATFQTTVAVPPSSFQVPSCGLSRLRTLELKVDSMEAIATLSHLPLLELLAVKIANSSNFSTKAGSGGFPSLVTLSCESQFDLSPFIGIIDLLAPSTPVANLSLTSTRPSPLTTLVGIIDLLPQRLNFLTLSSLYIAEGAIVHDDGVPLVDAATELLDDPLHLEHLNGFQALRDVQIDISTPISTGLQSLLALERLDLERLVIGSFQDPVHGQCTPKIKLQDLPEILETFPNIVVLGLPIDATDVPISTKRPGGGFEHGEPLTLLVGASPITKPQDVADFLSDIIPDLECIAVPSEIVRRDAWSAEGNPMLAKWEKVEEMVPWFRRIRDQERNTAALGLSESESEEG